MPRDLRWAVPLGLAELERLRQDEPPGCVTAEGFRGENASTSSLDATDAARKAFATLQAQAAMAGFSVEPMEVDDGRHVLIVSRWSLTKQCDTIDEARGLLSRMGVAV